MREKQHQRGLSSSYLEPDRYDDEEEGEEAISLAAIKSKYKGGGGLRGEDELFSHKLDAFSKVTEDLVTISFFCPQSRGASEDLLFRQWWRLWWWQSPEANEGQEARQWWGRCSIPLDRQGAVWCRAAWRLKSWFVTFPSAEQDNTFPRTCTEFCTDCWKKQNAPVRWQN